MISWTAIGYGAALSGVAAAALVAVALRVRRADVLAVALVAAVLGPLAWNAILRDTGARGFFVDAPLVVLPASWQDTGSGVFTLGTAALALGLGPLRGASGRLLSIAASLCAIAAFLVDVYLY